MLKALTGLLLLWTGLGTTMHGLVLLAAGYQPLLSFSECVSGIVLGCLSFMLIEEACQENR